MTTLILRTKAKIDELESDLKDFDLGPDAMMPSWVLKAREDIEFELEWERMKLERLINKEIKVAV